MGRRPSGRRPGWGARPLIVLLAVVIAVAGGAWAYGAGLLDVRVSGQAAAPSPTPSPGPQLPPPPGVSVPDAGPAPPVLAAATAAPPSPAGLRRVLRDDLRDRDFGPHLGVLVEDLATGKELLRHGGDSLFTPASTLKLLTSAAALEQLGPDHRFATRVLAGRGDNQIVLVGGGDPLLARTSTEDGYPKVATTEELAAETAAALGHRNGRVRLLYDDSLFAGPAVNPTWEPSYVPDQVVTPISALWVDEGLGPGRTGPRATDPAKRAAEAFAAQLRDAGVRVVGEPRRGQAPADAKELARVESPPLDQIVGNTLDVSDNEGAEVLLRQTAVAADRRPTFRGGVAAMRDTLADLGVDLSRAKIYDGSGLSRRNRVPLDAIAQTLRVAADVDHPELRSVVSRLPIAGFTGSLRSRFVASLRPAAEPGLGVVRAKTGTLSGVHGLAGVVVDDDNATLLFVAIADRVRLPKTLDARADLDNLAAEIADCGCR